MTAPAPSQQAHCLIRSPASSAFLLAVGVTTVLEHMGERARVLQDWGEQRRINDLRYPVGGVAALALAGPA